MKKYLKALTNLAVSLITFLLVIFLVPKLLVFFAPFIAGWVIALIAGPLVRFFEEKLKIKRKAGSVVVIVLVISLVVLGMYLAGARLLKEMIDLLNDLPRMWANVLADFNDIAEKFNVIYSRFPKDIQIKLSGFSEKLVDFLGNAVSSSSAPTIEAVGNLAKRVPSVIIGIIMALLSSYLFVAQREQIIVWLDRAMPKSVMMRVQMVRRSLVRAVGGYLKAQLLIEVWVYLLLVIGLSILGVDYVLLIALLIAFLDIIPFFGTGTVLFPWAVIKFLSSDYQVALGLLIVWGVTQLVRQFIQPKIVGDSVGVAPIPTLFLFYIGYRLGGVLGMIISVPLGLILYTLYEEGVFDTTKNSILILVNGVNRFRKLEDRDLEEAGIASKPEKKHKEEPHA